jgi:hypothetical protein
MAALPVPSAPKCPSLRASQVHASRGREHINNIFNSPNSTAAETYLTRTIEKYYKAASRLAEWLAANIPEDNDLPLPGCSPHPDPHH